MSIFPTRILVVTDGSREADLAASTAVDLANNSNSELHVLAVGATSGLGPIGETTAFGALPPTGYDDEAVDAARRDSRELLEEEVQKIKEAGGTVAGTHRRARERADQAIVHLAEELSAGLIVMGSRGVGGLKRALMGSVSDNVVRHAHCPVLVVRELRVPSTSRTVLGDLARPFLRELMEVSQESANLAVLEKNSVVYIEQVPVPSRTVRMFTQPGAYGPLHATGTGKAIVAFEPEEVRDSIVRQIDLIYFTPNTITDPERFREELDRIREQGYALDFEEKEEGVRCLAAPVFGPDGNVVAAMSISGPAGRLSETRLEELVPEIKRIAAACSDNLKTSWRVPGEEQTIRRG